ncbi:hypothetical protein [Paenibacillus contaminans]|uniref:hypothetical protein n=1 Tax=Paenibacillus contaminans TaxID=450362 RepID=UPI0013149A3B|nr:hypothetical protein [Paenibacillus contaminans]
MSAANPLCYYEAVSVFTLFWASMKIMMEELAKVLFITRGLSGRWKPKTFVSEKTV